MKRGYKWVGMVLALILFMFYGYGVKKTTLINRAIVVGMAVDREGDDLLVSAQIILPQSAEKPGGASNNIVSAKGKTISGAMNTLSKETSMVIALSHCNLVILGKNVLESGAYNVLDYLTRNAYLSENALLVASLDAGLDILKTKVAFSDMSSFYAQRTISSYGDYLGIARINIKDFMLNYHSDGGANWLTIIEKKETDNKDPSSDEKLYIFDLSSTAIIKKNRLMFNADKESTEGLSFYYSEIQNGSIFLDGDHDEAIEMYVINKKEKNKVDLNNLKMTTEVELVVVLKEIIKKTNVGGEEPVEKDKLSESETARLKKKVGDTLYKVFEESKSANTDIFDAYGNFYRRYGKKFKNMYDVEGFLQKLDFNVSIKIKYK